jgi:hypothetical protein
MSGHCSNAVPCRRPRQPYWLTLIQGDAVHWPGYWAIPRRGKRTAGHSPQCLWRQRVLENAQARLEWEEESIW